MEKEPRETGTEPEPAQFSVTIDQIQDYQFRVTFDEQPYGELMLDEAPPVGKNTGPNPSRLLAAALGDCLCASFLFAARKARANVRGIRASVKVWNKRNEQGRLRIGRMQVEIEPKYDPEDAAKIERSAALFEDFCVVTQSVRKGIEISVVVRS
jgi:uncharacterized OsmC-like protein